MEWTLIAVLAGVCAAQTILLCRRRSTAGNTADGTVVRMLEEHNSRIETSLNEASRDSAARMERVQTAAEAARDSAAGLQNVFRSSQPRGVWGEKHLEKTLSDAGLVEGTDYRTQTQTPGGGKPDIEILFTDGTGKNRTIPVDAKFPAPPFDGETGRPEDAEQQNKHFRTAAWRAVKTLAKREYGQQPGSVGWIIMYLPAESLYQPLTEPEPGKPSIVARAAEQQIMILPPSCLIPVAHLIAEVSRSDRYRNLMPQVGNLLGASLPTMVETVDYSSRLACSHVNKIVQAAQDLERKATGIMEGVSEMCDVPIREQEGKPGGWGGAQADAAGGDAETEVDRLAQELTGGR